MAVLAQAARRSLGPYLTLPRSCRPLRSLAPVVRVVFGKQTRLRHTNRTGLRALGMLGDRFLSAQAADE